MLISLLKCLELSVTGFSINKFIFFFNIFPAILKCVLGGVTRRAANRSLFISSSRLLHILIYLNFDLIVFNCF